jgi:hypothetical protein
VLINYFSVNALALRFRFFSLSEATLKTGYDNRHAVALVVRNNDRPRYITQIFVRLFQKAWKRYVSSFEGCATVLLPKFVHQPVNRPHDRAHAASFMAGLGTSAGRPNWRNSGTSARSVLTKSSNTYLSSALRSCGVFER